MDSKNYFKRVKEFAKKRVGGQSVLGNIAMFATVISSLLVVMFHEVIFTFLALFFAILWVVTSVGKNEQNQDYYNSNPDLEGKFLSWIAKQIKSIFRK
jgi:membrane protein required for beta-lactamase induction